MAWFDDFVSDDGFSDGLPLWPIPRRLSPYRKRATLNSSDPCLDIGQKFLRHVDARGFLKAQVAHIGIDLHQKGAIVGVDEVDA